MSASIDPQRAFALEVVQQLRRAGFEALWAGGCVRDRLLGRDPKDYDVATSALPDQVQQLFGQRRTLAIGAAFGVIAVRGPRSVEPIEVATFRTDGMYRDGRHPDSVAFSDAEHDAQRRDFTINGLFFDPLTDRVIDYVDGQHDLEARVIRAIGDPAARFREDKLRMLRAVRFAAAYDFAIEEGTLTAIQTLASEIVAVSGERIGAEVRRILEHPARSQGLELLRASGLLREILPELAGCDPGDAWERVQQRVRAVGAGQLPTMLAAVLFDAVAPWQMLEILRRLRYPSKEGELAEWLLAHAGDLAGADALAWPRLQRLLVHRGGSELVRLASAVRGCEDPGVVRARACLQWPPERLNPVPLVSGDDLIASGLAPGKHFGAVLDHLRDLQLEGKLQTRAEAIEEARRQMVD